MQLIKLALFLGVAAAAFGASSYHVKFSEPTIVNGNTLKAGEYRIEVDNDKATIREGHNVVEVPVRVETGTVKFADTAVLYGAASAPGSSQKNGDAPMQLEQIRIGGTHVTLNFEK